jgi:hypothetical protein
MKLSTFIPAIMLSLISANALADHYVCKPITGTIQPLIPDPACKIQHSKSKHLPDVTFYGVAGSCFSGQWQGQLDGTPLTGTSYSGLTVNQMGQITVASAFQLKVGPFELGQLFTKDVLFDAQGNTKELLTIVGGSKLFKGSYGNIEITGNTLYQAGSFTGTLCVED